MSLSHQRALRGCGGNHAPLALLGVSFGCRGVCDVSLFGRPHHPKLSPGCGDDALPLHANARQHWRPLPAGPTQGRDAAPPCPSDRRITDPPPSASAAAAATPLQLVLATAKAKAATQDILAQHCIASDRSVDLQRAQQGAAGAAAGAGAGPSAKSKGRGKAAAAQQQQEQQQQPDEPPPAQQPAQQHRKVRR